MSLRSNLTALRTLLDEAWQQASAGDKAKVAQNVERALKWWSTKPWEKPAQKVELALKKIKIPDDLSTWKAQNAHASDVVNAVEAATWEILDVWDHLAGEWIAPDYEGSPLRGADLSNFSHAVTMAAKRGPIDLKLVADYATAFLRQAAWSTMQCAWTDSVNLDYQNMKLPKVPSNPGEHPMTLLAKIRG